MPSEDEKSKIEIMTFRAFANCHGLPIDLNSVEKRDPPEPDILCKSLDESFIAFELAESVTTTLLRN